MERVVIPHDNQQKSNVDPSPAWVRDQSGEIKIRCQCGLLMALDHDISPKGEVNPSLFHDVPECGWHVFGTLQGWTE